MGGPSGPLIYLCTIMDWEEKFKVFMKSTIIRQDYEEIYGPIVGPWLFEYECRDLHGQASWRAKTRYEMLQEFFRDFRSDVPLWIQKDYIKGTNFNKDYLLENLKSHDWKKMWSAIQRYFGNNAGTVDGDTCETGSSLTRVVWSPVGTKEKPIHVLYQDIANEESEDGKALQRILKFYGYFISKVRKGRYIELEPEWPESASDYVYNTCKGIVYILVPSYNVPQILKQGLKCANGNKIEWREWFKSQNGRYPTWEETNSNFVPYRFFPKRIYFSAFRYRQGGEVPEDELRDLCNELGRDWEEVRVLRADLRGHNISVYRDPAMHSEHAFFTYENIPKQLLTVVCSRNILLQYFRLIQDIYLSLV